MSRIHWLSPGDPGQRTGGYLYNGRMIAGLEGLGHDVVVHALPGVWPWPGDEELGRCGAALRAIGDGEPVVADGLLWTGLAAHGSALAARCPVTVLLHSPLHVEAADPAGTRSAERAALAGVGRVVTSRQTADDLGIEAHLVVPGTDPAPTVRPPARDEVVLLCVATLTARKGHDVLLEALATLTDRSWRLRCAGEPRDPQVARRLADQVEALGLSDRVAFLGNLGPDALDAAWADADVLVHAARYEAWGMALTEAMSRGVPVVSTPAGALDAVSSEAYVGVPSEDAGALAAALGRLLDDRALRAALSAAARRAADGLPTWSAQVRRLANLLEVS